MLTTYYIVVIIYVVTIILELKLRSVPSEQSQQALLKKGLTGRDGAKFILGQISIIGFVVIMIYPIFDSSILHQNWRLGVGSLLIIFGRVITFIGSNAIYKHFRKQEEVLLDYSIYKISRNPILLGFMISHFGSIVVINCGWVPYIFPIIYFFSMHLKVLDEEKLLADKYLVEFDKYRQFTRRYI